VYLADDLKHERKVALKVLKPELAAVVGAERFLAEIKTTANLQHPHILPLFDSGEADSFLFYVMPYVEGETLRDRIDREKQLPVDEAVKIATDLAEALDYAHRHKIIHRDIKPANILIHEGRSLIADFGIALAVGVAGGGRLTETGLSVGTPHYMSPEQATGDQAVGVATDIYALGAVLYEMLIGDPPYMGSTAQAILGRIIAGKVASAIEERTSVPANVDAAIRKALEKLPADRFKSAQEFGKALEDEHFRHGELAVAGGGGVVAGPWKRLTMTFAALAAMFALAFGWALLRPEAPAPVVRFSSPFEEGQAPIRKVQFTTDGSSLVYVGPGASDQSSQLWIRRWDNLDATPIRGTEGADGFALSPDGREVAFSPFEGPLRVVALDGGPGRTLADLVTMVWDWTPDGDVYFTSAPPTFLLSRVPATGGGSEAVEIVTERREGEIVQLSLSVLPGGKMGVFKVLYPRNPEDAEVWAIDLDTRERRFLVAGTSPSYASTGHLLFGTPDGALMAAPIDASTAELTGPSVPVAEGLQYDGEVTYSVSEDGTLVYRAGESGFFTGQNEFMWVTRSGEATVAAPGHTFPAQPNQGWRLSPDETRIAFNYRDDQGNNDVRIKDLPDGPEVRITFSENEDIRPFWTLDGQSVTYFSRPGEEDFNVWSKRADGIGEPVLVLDDERSFAQGLWSPDGESLVLRAAGSSFAAATAALRAILAFRPGVDSAAVPLSLAAPEFRVEAPGLSADGRWLAYQSNEGGEAEVFIRPFPDVNATKVRVSTEGGIAPVWAKSGSELFFIEPGTFALISAQIDPASGQVLDRQTLFTIPDEYYVIEATYEPHSDGERFLMVRRDVLDLQDAAKFVVVLNWFTELRQRMGSN
jgi:serine/threonine-protein kinase